jgi:hypothetical protein
MTKKQPDKGFKHRQHRAKKNRKPKAFIKRAIRIGINKKLSKLKKKEVQEELKYAILMVS